MRIPGGLQEAELIQRYKRFLADVILADGSRITLHCPNTGSMKNCAEPGSRVWFSTADNPARKYSNTWEVVEVAGKWLAGINTGRANALVAEAIEAGHIRELAGYGKMRREVKYGEQGSRIDLLLEMESSQAPLCFVEVKNVTLKATLDTDQNEADGNGLFPDAVTVRGQKHLNELMKVVQQGNRAVLMFCVQHTGIKQVAPADGIDPEYGKLLRQAHEAGVEILAYGAQFNLPDAEISLRDAVPIML
ncbi:MAG: DNA/RNA nuclease SfsA [Pseudohongiellaceae bacterium]